MASKRGEAKVRAERTPAGPDLASSVPWYRLMVLTRRFEDEAERAFRRGKIGGYLHLYSGQEAVAAGFLAAIRADDIFFTAYRDHAHAIFRGTPPEAVMAELFGKQTGVAKGKGGSMHLFDVPRGLYGGYGIVGAHIPLATGAAYALRYQGTDRVCLCFLGDGAMNSGSFHEPVNMAAVWGQDGMCPIVYIVENNKYAMGTSVDRSTVVTHLASKFGLHGIENEQADGQDFLTVRRGAGGGECAGGRDPQGSERDRGRRHQVRGGEPRAAAGGTPPRRLRAGLAHGAGPDVPRRAARHLDGGDGPQPCGCPPGRGHRRLPGHLPHHRRLPDTLWAQTGHRHADRRTRLRRRGRWHGDAGTASRGRGDDLELLPARRGPDPEQRGEAALLLRRPGERPAGDPRPQRRRRAALGAALPEPGGALRPFPRTVGGGAGHAGGRAGAAPDRAARQGPGGLPGERRPLRREGRSARRRRPHPLRAGGDHAPRA